MAVLIFFLLVWLLAMVAGGAEDSLREPRLRPGFPPSLSDAGLTKRLDILILLLAQRSDCRKPNRQKSKVGPLATRIMAGTIV